MKKGETATSMRPTKLRRTPIPKYRPGELYAQWGRCDRHARPDVCAVGLRSDTALFLNAFCFQSILGGKTFIGELESRGYDITTLKFSIRKKVSPDV